MGVRFQVSGGAGHCLHCPASPSLSHIRVPISGFRTLSPLSHTSLSQGQANKWIRNMEASRQLMVLKPAASDYLRQVRTV